MGCEEQSNGSDHPYTLALTSERERCPELNSPKIRGFAEQLDTGRLPEQRRRQIANVSTGIQMIEHVIHVNIEVEFESASLYPGLSRARLVSYPIANVCPRRALTFHIPVPKIVVRHDSLAGHGIRIECAEFCDDDAGAREVRSESRAVRSERITVQITADSEIVRRAGRHHEHRAELQLRTATVMIADHVELMAAVVAGPAVILHEVVRIRRCRQPVAIIMRELQRVVRW